MRLKQDKANIEISYLYIISPLAYFRNSGKLVKCAISVRM